MFVHFKAVLTTYDSITNKEDFIIWDEYSEYTTFDEKVEADKRLVEYKNTSPKVTLPNGVVIRPHLIESLTFDALTISTNAFEKPTVDLSVPNVAATDLPPTSPPTA